MNESHKPMPWGAKRTGLEALNFGVNGLGALAYFVSGVISLLVSADFAADHGDIVNSLLTNGHHGNNAIFSYHDHQPMEVTIVGHHPLSRGAELGIAGVTALSGVAGVGAGLSMDKLYRRVHRTLDGKE